MPVKFVLFDLDGTLVDSVPQLFRAFEEWLSSIGALGVMPQAESFDGLSIFEIVAEVRRAAAIDLPIAELERRYFAHVLRVYDDVIPVDGAEDLLRTIKERGIARGLVTSAPVMIVEPLINRLGWESLFDLYQTGAPGEPSKPDPYPYREAVAQLGGMAAEGLAIEDSRHGVISARRADLRVVGFSRNGAGADLINAGAQAVIARLHEAEVLL